MAVLHAAWRRVRLAVLACVATTTLAAAAPLPPGVERDLGLAELGYADGLAIEGLGATRELFLPLPDLSLIAAARLVLHVESQSLFPGRRSVEILANGRPVLARALPDEGAQQSVAIALSAEDLRRGNGFLRLTIRSIGVATDGRCLDLRLAGERLTLLPASRLELQLAAGAALSPAALFRLLPREVTVVTRAGTLTPEEAAAALTAAQAVAASGHQVGFATIVPQAAPGPWRRGAVVIHPPGDGPADGVVAVETMGGRPALVLRGARPDLAARLIAEPWREATPAGAEVSAAAAGTPADAAAMTLAELRGNLAAVDVIERGSWTLDFTTRDLPPGMKPARLALDMAAAPDHAGERPVVSVFLNEVLIGSEALGPGMPGRLMLPIPAGLVALENQLRIVAQRRPRGGDCEALPAPLPVQILPSSRLELSAAGAPTDFFQLASRFSGGATILTDAPPDADRLPMIFALLRTQLHPDAALALVAGRRPPDDGAFIAFTEEAPEGIRPPPVRFDRGRLRLDGRDGRVLLDISGPPRELVAQLVTSQGGAAGIWVRPPADPAAVPATLRLDRGDVAFANAQGIMLAWSSGRDALVEVAYRDHTSVEALLERYRPGLAAMLWLGVTAVAVVSVVRVRRRRRGAAPEEG